MFFAEWSEADRHWRVVTQDGTLFRTCHSLQAACVLMADIRNDPVRWQYARRYMRAMHRYAVENAIKRNRKRRNAK